MKILQVAGIDNFAQKFLKPLMDSLVHEGHHVEIACCCTGQGAALQEDGYIVHHIPFTRNINIVSHLANVLRLARLIREKKYDCIHVHNPVASLIARLAGKISGVPHIIYTAHGFYFHENMNRVAYGIVYCLEKIWARLFTDYLFFQSEEDYNLALKKNFNNKKRLVHIGNGVSTSVFNPLLYDRMKLRSQMGFEPSDIVIIFVGRPVLEKGIMELLEAYRLIREGCPQIKLMLVGCTMKGDRGVASLTDLIRNTTAKFESDIFILGFRDDIPQLMSSADIFILPSYREGLPRSIIEAMAMGKPIIATNIRGCREEVCDGVNGYLCEVKNTDDLAAKINMLLKEPGMIEKFGRNSRKLFLDKYDEQVALEKQLKVFRRMS